MLTSTVREGDGEAVIGEPLHERQNEQGGWTPTRDHVGKVDAVVKEKVGVQPLTVLVYQSSEAQASPTWVALP